MFTELWETRNIPVNALLLLCNVLLIEYVRHCSSAEGQEEARHPREQQRGLQRHTYVHRDVSWSHASH